MLEKLWAFFFGGEVEQQVLVVKEATLQDAYEFRHRSSDEPAQSQPMPSQQWSP